MTSLLRRAAVGVAVVGLAGACLAIAAEEPNLTEDQIREFLLHAKVVQSHQTSKGVTAPWRLTLTDGKLTHDAAFQSIEEFKVRADFPSRTEFNFRDSYEFNIAAYELAKLLGLGDMVPVTVAYRWKDTPGSLSWWLPAKLDEEERQKQKLEAPDANAWNKQLNRMWVFSQLVYDTDRNQTNMLISEDWKLWMIDFSRAFRPYSKLLEPQRLVMCDRQLLEKLRRLDGNEVLAKTKPHLSKSEVKWIMARRDLIVAHFEKLIAEKGENAVLY
ncbi:MAG: hypothetical protein LAN62_19010 [Acidobacteriia bacterium]|nr:hypothetical protein [Terriglobia bacterium]